METSAPLPPLILPHGSLYVCTHGQQRCLSCEGHLEWLPQVFTCTPPANMKSITWHHRGNRLIFSWCLVVGEIHEGHRCTVVPAQWIIDPVPRVDAEVSAANDKEDAPEPGPAMSLWMGGGDGRAWGRWGWRRRTGYQGDRKVEEMTRRGEAERFWQVILTIITVVIWLLLL